MCGVPPKLRCGVVGTGVLAPPNGVPPMGVILLGVPKCRGWRRLGVEKSPLTGGPPGFSEDGVLMFAALGVRKPPTGLGVATAGAGEAAICPMDRFILVGDIIRPVPYNFRKQEDQLRFWVWRISVSGKVHRHLKIIQSTWPNLRGITSVKSPFPSRGLDGISWPRGYIVILWQLLEFESQPHQ